MKRKILFSLAATALFSGVAMKSQAQLTTGNTILAVTLANASSIVVAPAAALVFTGSADYTTGVSSLPGVLSTISTQPYSVTVYATDDLIFGSNSIPITDITVTPTVTLAPGASVTAHSIPKGATSPQQIIHSTTGSLVDAYTLVYSTPPGSADFINKPAGIYSATLVYTITNP